MDMKKYNITSGGICEASYTGPHKAQMLTYLVCLNTSWCYFNTGWYYFSTTVDLKLMSVEMSLNLVWFPINSK